MGERSRPLLRAAAAAALLLVVAGCSASRPTGDFGRARESVLHDEMMRAVGNLKRAHVDKKPVSNFNQTDQEREMHDRVWRYLTAAHAKDWSFDVSVEFQRTRIGVTDHKFKTDRYYKVISSDRYASSRVRYATMADHISIDIDLMPTTFRSICAVIEVDRQRAVAAAEIIGLEPAMRQQQRDRRAENDEKIGWFVRAIRYRYESFTYALEHLLVETPHEEAVRVDGLLSQLLGWVEQGERGDFCSQAGIYAEAGNGKVPSRVLMGDGKVYRK
ncbi:MAG: hypothetical protein EOP19_05025 [Hyphomicrobiales bacterium]|nr:MAG: hypothetical protein EOP19_05025 [Hyphomicrobiales bacterium]